MIEELAKLLIEELGPTGILICGLYFLLGKHMKKICYHIETMNQELGEIRDIIKSAIEKKNK